MSELDGVTLSREMWVMSCGLTGVLMPSTVQGPTALPTVAPSWYRLGY